MFPPLLLGAVVSGVAAAGSLAEHYRQQLGPMTLAEVRALATLAPTAIAKATGGFVKIVGVLGSEHPTTSLHGAIPSAVREVQHFTEEGRGLRARRVLARVERSEAPFFIDDGTGRVVLAPGACRIDFEVESADGEALVDEVRLRVGERVAVLGSVERVASAARHPLRQAPSALDDGLRFVGRPVVTWRTEPEVLPRLLPSGGGVALSASTVGLAVLGAMLRL